MGVYIEIIPFLDDVGLDEVIECRDERAKANFMVYSTVIGII